MATSTVHEERFAAHENLIVQVIERQAGTLSKAILEGVMNSVDAGATKIDIKISGDIVVIDDDGCGFVSVEQVRENFKIFGQPHELDSDGISKDARYGTFRIGRGQLFTFGINLWDSNKLTLEVDVRNKGLDFRIHEHPKVKHKGCRIRIALYHGIDAWMVTHTCDELARFCRYVAVPVTLNGKLVSVDPATEQWDHETDFARVRTSNASAGQGIDVYNDGVFVETIWRSTYGCSGVVVSKKGLKMNTARNQVIRTCKVWADIALLLQGVSDELIKKKKKLDPDEIKSVWDQLMSNRMRFKAALDMRIFLDATGKSWSYKDLIKQTSQTSTRRLFELSECGELRIAFGADNDRLADTLMQRGVGLVLSEQMLGLARVGDAAGFAVVLKSFSEYGRSLKCKLMTFKELAKGRDNQGYEALDPRKYTKSEARILKLLNSVSWVFRGLQDNTRTITIGLSETANGWTDGRTYIAIQREFLNRNKSGAINDWTALVMLIGHEYQHDFDSGIGHVHDEHFYRAYHDWTIQTAPRAVDMCYNRFIQLMKQGEKTPKGMGHQRVTREEWRQQAMAKLEAAES